MLIALINSKTFDSFTDDLYEEISKSLAEEFSEAYVGMEKDARRLVNRVFEGHYSDEDFWREHDVNDIYRYDTVSAWNALFEENE